MPPGFGASQSCVLKSDWTSDPLLVFECLWVCVGLWALVGVIFFLSLECFSFFDTGYDQ